MTSKNLTPPHMRCGSGGCPSIHQLEDGSLLIVGTHVREIADVTREEVGVAPTEAAIIVVPALLSGVTAQSETLWMPIEENDEIVTALREAAKEVFGANCSFADDDLALLKTCAKWAIRNGIPDDTNLEIVPRAKALHEGDPNWWHKSKAGNNSRLLTIANGSPPSTGGEGK